MQTAEAGKIWNTRMFQLFHRIDSAPSPMARPELVRTGLTHAALAAVLQARRSAKAANCRLFHQHRLQGPFSDEGGAYFLCEVGHRIPLSILPASRPPAKARVWSSESAVPSPQQVSRDASSSSDEMRRFVQTLTT
jgi:hypothetical protein